MSWMQNSYGMLAKSVYKIRTRGQRSCEITIPPEWLRARNLEPGDEIKMEPGENGRLIIMPMNVWLKEREEKNKRDSEERARANVV